MSRQPITPKLRTERRQIGSRMRGLRRLVHGGTELRPGGLDLMAMGLGCPKSTYEKYEQGVACPAEVMLRMVVQYDVSPIWLLTGDGPMFSRRPSVPTAVNGGGEIEEWDD